MMVHRWGCLAPSHKPPKCGNNPMTSPWCAYLMLDGLLVDDIGEEEGLWASNYCCCMYVERNWLPLFHGCCSCKSKQCLQSEKKNSFSFFHTTLISSNCCKGKPEVLPTVCVFFNISSISVSLNSLLDCQSTKLICYLLLKMLLFSLPYQFAPKKLYYISERGSPPSLLNCLCLSGTDHITKPW